MHICVAALGGRVAGVTEELTVPTNSNGRLEDRTNSRRGNTATFGDPGKFRDNCPAEILKDWHSL